MTSPIRPSMTPTTPVRPLGGTPTAADAARAAQRAFFSQALNAAQAQAPLTETSRTAPLARPATAEVNRVRTLPDQEPERPLRPGSLLDIRV